MLRNYRRWQRLKSLLRYLETKDDDGQRLPLPARVKTLLNEKPPETGDAICGAGGAAVK